MINRGGCAALVVAGASWSGGGRAGRRGRLRCGLPWAFATVAGCGECDYLDSTRSKPVSQLAQANQERWCAATRYCASTRTPPRSTRHAGRALAGLEGDRGEQAAGDPARLRRPVLRVLH